MLKPLWPKYLSQLICLKLISFIFLIVNLACCWPIRKSLIDNFSSNRQITTRKGLIDKFDNNSLLKKELKWTGYCGNAKYDLLTNNNNNNYVKRNYLLSKNDIWFEENEKNFTKNYNIYQNNYDLNYQFDTIDNNDKSSMIIDDYFNNSSRMEIIPELFRKQEIKLRKVPRSSEFADRLKNEGVVVRLNIIYDDAFHEEYINNFDELEKYFRNLIYATQLIFEQPEMSSKIKFNLVVVNLKKTSSNLNLNEPSNLLLDKFVKSNDMLPQEKADLNILMLFSNMWDLLSNGSEKKLLGLGHMGVFCNRNRPNNRATVITANSLGSSVTLAHELAHNFNCLHDGSNDYKERFEYRCNSNSNIMSPTSGPEKLTWSTCSVLSIAYSFTYDYFVSKCIFDKNRLANAKPFKPMFDFTNNENNLNRKILPGEDMSIDMQCSGALDRTATSSLTKRGNNLNRYTTCQDLVCLLGGVVAISIGPAPSGSTCDNQNSKCFNAVCQRRISN